MATAKKKGSSSGGRGGGKQTAAETPAKQGGVGAKGSKTRPKTDSGGGKWPGGGKKGEDE